MNMASVAQAAYEEADAMERSSWETLSVLSPQDAGYRGAMEAWHEAVQAMTAAVEKMFALRTSGAFPIPLEQDGAEQDEGDEPSFWRHHA